MRELCTPRYEKIFHFILGSALEDLGVAFLVKLRQDIREVIRYCRFGHGNDMEDVMEQLNYKLSDLQALDRDIQSILSSLFRPGALNLQQITYDKTPASIIEQIAFKEAVHPLKSLQDLRTRLGKGRRCFAFFHPALPDTPLVFVHIALLREIPESMDALQQGTERILNGTDDESRATCATFYSITNAEPGLAGVDLGNHLIKSVVHQLRVELPNLDKFCTLSPIPNFYRWLEGKVVRHNEGTFTDDNLFSHQELDKLRALSRSDIKPPLLTLLDTLKDPQRWSTDVQLQHQLKPLLLKLAAYHLTKETHHGRPLCPVAKFHIRNGAEMYRLNYLADTSSKGMRNSCGIMMNYRYVLEDMEDNHVRYEMTGEVAVCDGVRRWL